jgi:hypothetical protein
MLVGVMPKRFTKRAADLYRPYALDRADPRISQLYFQFQARLKPGLTPRDVETEIGVIAHNLAKQYPIAIRRRSPFAPNPGWIALWGSSRARFSRSPPRWAFCC